MLSKENIVGTGPHGSVHPMSEVAYGYMTAVFTPEKLVDIKASMSDLPHDSNDLAKDEVVFVFSAIERYLNNEPMKDIDLISLAFILADGSF